MPLSRSTGRAPAAPATGLDDFRVTAPAEIAALLRRAVDTGVTINLNASDGSVLGATLWAVDAERGSIGLRVEAGDPALGALLECQEAVAVCYLDSVKLQFDLADLVFVTGASTSVLQGACPRELFRFQRRHAFRVRPLLRSTPVARLRHTDIAEMQLGLRVLDLSIGGCALFLPDDVPAMQVGGVMNQVLFELDADTRFHVNLRLQHVTSLNPEARGVRLGCEFVNADAATLRALQRFIDLTQKRSRLFAAGG